MKFIRVLSRVALLSLAAALFAGLTYIYGGSVRSPSPDPQWRAGRDHRPSAPEFGAVPELFGEVLVVAIYAAAGRIVLRLRLSSAPRREGQPVLLGLHEAVKSAKSS